MFQITGIKNNKKVSVHMSDGVLYGDDKVIELINRENEEDHGWLGIPPSVETKNRYLLNECSAYELIVSLFDTVLSSKTDWQDAHEGLVY